MADLRRLETNYPKDYCPAAFENMCTLMFCTHLGLSHGVNRRVNQGGVEADPVAKDGRVHAYQAKYYSGPLTRHKDELKRSVSNARQRGVTDLHLFVNQNLTEVSKTGGDPEYLKEVEGVASGGGGVPSVRLHWWTRSKIEDTLDMPGYRYIQAIHLGTGHAAFYEHVCGQFDDDEGDKLYGRIPLRECYIEPTVEDEDGNCSGVREYIESRIEGDDEVRGTITVICGEPGHGKTSLCHKAVRDFYRDGWLAGKVTNALCFSLNPAGTDALEHEPLRFNSLLSWEDLDGDRMDEGHKMKPSSCHRALVLLDGFDELLEWHPKFDLEGFIKRFVIGFQRNTRSHVVITTRRMAVDPDRRRYGDGVPIVRLQLVSKARQLEWIGRCADYYRRLASGEAGPSARVSKDEAGEKLGELEGYLRDYERLHEDATLQKILGIPIILRMVVAERYVPEGEKSIVQVYDELFARTWERHTHRAESPEGDRAQLSRHALRIYAGEADTAPVDDFLKSPWQFSFYTSSKGEMRVGFLHRSFYQYFLAHEVVLWLEKCAGNGEKESREKALRANLAYLARRQLDKTTLGYIGEIHESLVRDGVSLPEDSLDMAYEVMRDTDGFLPPPENEKDADGIKTLAPLARANNVFWNVVSVCSACGRKMTADRVNVEALRLYDLSECVLSGARMEGLVLSGARLSRAHLAGAHLERADLRGAHLERAHLEVADLERADLRGAHLERAHLERADLRGAHLEWAHLERADLRGAHLERADLCGAHLEWADLEWADLEGADLRGAHLEGADLEGVIRHDTSKSE